MRDPALSIAELLVSKGYGTFGGTAAFDVHVGQLPDKPDAVILVNAVGGRPPHPRLSLNEPSVQIIVRGAPSGYVAASNKIRAIVDTLLGMPQETISGDIYQGCTQIGDVTTLGQDVNARPMFSANFHFIVEPAVAGGHRVSIT